MRGIIQLVVLQGIAATLALTGCMSTTGMHDELEGAITDRTGYKVSWHSHLEDQAMLQEHTRVLLRDTLQLEHAVQIALLNNRHLQAVYETAGIAQADLIQASLFTNPELDTHAGFSVEGEHEPDLAFSLAVNILDVFHMPLRKAVAQSNVEEARIRVTRDVLTLVTNVQYAFYAHQAALQLEELRSQASNSAQASFETSSLLREAGNIPAVDMNNERVFYEQTRLELAYARLAVIETRELLNQLMGVWGDNAVIWKIRHRLPDLEELPESLELAEQVAIESSLDLALIEQELETLAHREGVINATALLPHLKVGIDAEREGEWEIGPGIGLPLPLFDRGQARKATISALIRQKQASYYGVAVDVRVVARTLRQQLVTSYTVARHYQEVIVPLSSQVSAGVFGQYNAMQVGVFQLLVAQQREIQAGVAYIESLRNYWMAHATYEALLRGIVQHTAMPAEPTNRSAVPVSGSTDTH